jgi:myo-inositol-1(or 4)-monophosphatase
MIDSSRWLETCRQVASEAAERIADAPQNELSRELGQGAGGDRTLVVDAIPEDLLFASLERLRAAGESFTVVSEERGEVSFGASSPIVAVDPVDGSLNARRGGSHFAFSLAVADGPRTSDVRFGYVYDFGSGREWSAQRGRGAYAGTVRLDGTDEHRVEDGRLELLAIETSDARYLARAGGYLGTVAHKTRTPGSIAVAICHVASGQVDAMANLSPCRSIDAAAAALIAAETGAYVSYPGCAHNDPKLDLDSRQAIVIARSPAAVRALTVLVEHAGDPS